MSLVDDIGKLYRELEHELRFFAEDQKFYSVREIMRSFSVSRRVVDGALAKLESRGMIRRESRTGIYSNGVDYSRQCTILMANPDWPAEAYTDWERCLNSEAEKRGDIFRTIRYDWNRPLVPQLPKNGYDVLLLRGTANNLTADTLYKLSNIDHPVILCGCRSGDIRFSYVCGDNEFAAVKVCLHLHRMHHRKILVIQGEPASGTNQLVLSVFGSMAQMLGMEYTVLDCHTRSGESSALKSYDTFKEFLNKNRDSFDFTAIFAISGATVQPVMTVLREAGIETPEEVGIISISSSNYGQFFHPPLTVMSFSIEEQVAAVFEGIDYLLKNPSGVFTKKVSARLIKRNSLLNLGPTEITPKAFNPEVRKKKASS